MKLWKKILIVVSIILCVGLLGASIARTAVKPVTVGRSGSGNSATSPAATQPAQEPQIEYVNDGKIYLLVQDDTEDSGYNVVVYEDDVLVEPLYISPTPAPSNAKPHYDDNPIPMKVYRVTPGDSELRFVSTEAKSETKGGDSHDDVKLFDVYLYDLPLSDDYGYMGIYDVSSYLTLGLSIPSSALFVIIFSD